MCWHNIDELNLMTYWWPKCDDLQSNREMLAMVSVVSGAMWIPRGSWSLGSGARCESGWGDQAMWRGMPLLWQVWAGYDKRTSGTVAAGGLMASVTLMAGTGARWKPGKKLPESPRDMRTFVDQLYRTIQGVALGDEVGTAVFCHSGFEL